LFAVPVFTMQIDFSVPHPAVVYRVQKRAAFRVQVVSAFADLQEDIIGTGYNEYFSNRIYCKTFCAFVPVRDVPDAVHK